MADLNVFADEEELEAEAEHVLVVPSKASESRLDAFLTSSLEKYTRSFIQKLIEEGRVEVSGRQVKKSNFRLSAGQEVALSIPAPEQLRVDAEQIPLNIAYEDDQLLVVNKPQGMVVHPAAGNYRGTMVNALLCHCKDLSGINGVLRPGIVHRIDKDTSGLLVVAKTEAAHLGLAEQIKAHTMSRRYRALVHGVMPEPGGTIEAPVGRDPKDRKKMAVVHVNSKHAVTHYRVIERFRDYTFVECILETGRTHQIRVHMNYINHPVAGDPLYGPRKTRFNLEGQALHAAVLGFVHPTRNEYMEFSAPLPEYFDRILAELREAK